MAEEYYQDPEDAALMGAATGALAGAPLGPPGIIFGAVIGAGLGSLNASKQNRAISEAKAAADQKRRNALVRRQNARMQADSLSAAIRQPQRSQGSSRVNSQPQNQTQGTIGENVSNVISSSGTF